MSVFGQPSGSGSGPFDDIIDDVISRFPERSKVTKFKPHSHKRNFFAESIDKIDEAVDAVGSDAGNGTQNGKINFSRQNQDSNHNSQWKIIACLQLFQSLLSHSMSHTV